MIKLIQFVEYHQYHPINYSPPRILNWIRTTTLYPIMVPSMISSLGHCSIYSPRVLLRIYMPPPRLGSNPPISPFLPLAAWRSHRAGLYRCTRREIATWVVTNIIFKRCSLQTPFLHKGRQYRYTSSVFSY